MRIVVDAMGSDRAPGPEVAGALRAVRAHAIDVSLIGDRSSIEAELSRAGRTAADRIEIVHASEVVTMHDQPGQAFRGKPDSSMRVAVGRVAEGQGDAVISAGNSGAMYATALFVLGRLAGVERPAIVTVLPTPSGPLVLCDAGANTEPKPAHLAQFGVIAAAYDRIAHDRARPRLGLLSNGTEPGKGTPLTREAHAILSAAHGDFQYVGYIEGSDLFRGVVDVIATDGFTGNVVLKTCEGIAEGMFGLVRQELEKTPLARLGSALVAPALRGLAKRIDYTEIGGALLAGVTKTVVIAHGRSDANAIASAIRAAAQFAERALPDKLAAALSAIPA
ncbi:MAG: fatty acid/phospholipid synthesis protein PlsX [Myxococcales bacterium]|nr:fatty acid/phospholipid synthesis protein PlsX [Myxococcales bacterium]